MKIKELIFYPIKSCRGIHLSHAKVGDKGLSDYNNNLYYDRTFMIVDESGKFITQRQYPQLARVIVTIEGKKITLSFDDSSMDSITFIPQNQGNTIEVQVWGDRTSAINQGKEVAQWFQEILSVKNCRLVKQDDYNIRAINPQYSTQSNQPVSFADGFPYLLTNTASLDYLNQKLKEKYPHQQQQISMDRFRPNIVIETDTPFIEDTWENITLDEIKFKIAKPCSRCNITTTDQITGKINPQNEPLKTLSSFRNVPQQGIMFGQNMIALNRGQLTINHGK
ncbi:Flavodoxin reductases (ferredoxin-NADPH reductases) family 1 [Cyanobacterium sp. HL-69]|uniref:MOSC domain-containing protein n=1 Tax=Cyanobacterium sp. HL-69 TaxID=2054282 RepID=UPI000CA33CB5|nr:Flavodoxin reductases (ferredoxin-NADPH reductases) family 1 [Cyanobacterium sp. HL-69]